MITIADNIITFESTRTNQEDKLAFEEAIRKIEKEGYNEILLDLEKTIYIPSELLGFLMGKKRSLNKENKDIKIIAISESLKRIFDEALISEFLGV